MMQEPSSAGAPPKGHHAPCILTAFQRYAILPVINWREVIPLRTFKKLATVWILALLTLTLTAGCESRSEREAREALEEAQAELDRTIQAREDLRNAYDDFQAALDDYSHRS